MKAPNYPEEKPMMQNLTVTGMTCGHCEKAVQGAILGLDPQAKVTIDRSKNQVLADTTATREALTAAITEEGYTVAA
jgi:copper chaperone